MLFTSLLVIRREDIYMQPFRVTRFMLALTLVAFPSLLICAEDVSVAPAAAQPEAPSQPDKRSDENETAAQSPVSKQSSDDAHSEKRSPSPADHSGEQEEAKSEEEMDIRSAGESFVKAFCSANADEVAAHFTPTAEYLDEHGKVFEGRDQIAGLMKSIFENNEGCHLELQTDSIRIVNPGLAIEDGTTILTPPGAQGDDEETCTIGGYTAVHVKTDGKWLIASLRELPVTINRSHRSQLRQLAWLQGDWVDESDESVVLFSCELADRGNFLVRKFVIHVEGQETMNGTQRVGWDPLTGKLKSWIFDSEGGYAEGYWYRDDDTWMLKVTGVTADGEPASSTSVYTRVNSDTIVWQSIDHEVGGIKLPDTEEVTIVRRAPTPDMADSNSHTESQ